MAKDKVYICWVEQDRRWYEELLKFLHALKGQGISIWDHSQIGAGQEREKVLRQALTEVRLAVLLISQDLLNSDGVNKIELPALLSAREQGVPLLCIYANYSTVARASFTYKAGWVPRSCKLTEITPFKDNGPKLPLAAILDEAERNRILCDIADEIYHRAVDQSRPSAAPDEAAEPYLLISINAPPSPPQSPAAAPPTCRLRAWLLGLADSIALSTPDDDITLSALQDHLSRLRDEAYRHLLERRIPADRFPVEFLLPQALLTQDVDQWVVQSPRRSMPLGRAHPVVVRPLERALYPEFGVRHQARWRRFRSVAEERVTVATMDRAGATVAAWLRSAPLMGADLAAQLENCDVVCAVLPEPPPPEVLDSLLEAGVPVALWTRRTCEEGYLRGLVERDRLGGLPHRVWDARKAAGTEPPQEHGCHLTLLWDDPERQPPDIVSLLQPPLRAPGEEP